MYIEFVKANSFKGNHRGRVATPLYFLFVSYRRLKQSLLAIVNTLYAFVASARTLNKQPLIM